LIAVRRENIPGVEHGVPDELESVSMELLVPDLVTTFTTPDEVCPYSTLKLFV